MCQLYRLQEFVGSKEESSALTDQENHVKVPTHVALSTEQGRGEEGSIGQAA